MVKGHLEGCPFFVDETPEVLRGDDTSMTVTHTLLEPHHRETSMEVRRYLCRLVIEDWVRLRRYPVESVWLSLLNHIDGIDSVPGGLLVETDQLTVKPRKEP